jgi:hypothetical protein
MGHLVVLGYWDQWEYYELNLVTDYRNAASGMFKPHGQQTIQFLKWWLFQALPLIREPATKHRELAVTYNSHQKSFVATEAWL